MEPNPHHFFNKKISTNLLKILKLEKTDILALIKVHDAKYYFNGCLFESVIDFYSVGE